MTTNQLRLPALRPHVGLQLPSGAWAAVLGLPAAAALGAVGALHPEWWRGLLAAVLLVNGVLLAMKWPRAAVLATLLYLPFVALIRRLLIEEAGWVQNDPLLLVGPVMALFLCYRLFLVERRRLAEDRISKLVVLLLVIAFFGAFNPIGSGGLLGGLSGLLFLAVPLLWFFIGRELGTERMVTWLVYAVAIVSTLIAAYGLYQTELGSMPQWDVDWYEITGYSGAVAGRSEGGSELIFRPWGTFASASEYSGYLGIGLVLTLAFCLHRRLALAALVPVLALAVFWAGGRAVMALVFLTVIVMLALRTRNALIALAVIVLGIGATYGAALAFGDRLDRAAGVSGNPNVERQTGGLLNPLDPNESSFLGHWDNLVTAVGDGFTNPVGEGTGATNLGARLGGSGARETDIDIGDAFVSFGFVGGFVFLAIIVFSFRTVFRRYLRSPPTPLLLGVAGVMVVSLGQWLQGGHYAASAVLWFLLGWAVRPSPESLAEEKPILDRLGRLTGRPVRGKQLEGTAL